MQREAMHFEGKKSQFSTEEVNIFQDAFIREGFGKIQTREFHQRTQEAYVTNFVDASTDWAREHTLTNHFGLSSNKTPPTILELKPFEEGVLKLLENIKFRDTKNHFQETLANDLKKINSSDKIFVFADKTRNIYETSLDT